MRNELRVGALNRNAEEANREHHFDLIEAIVGDDFEGVDDSEVSTGWLFGDGPNLVMSFARGSGSEAHQQVALKLIHQWAAKEGLRVSVLSATSE